MFKFLLQNLFLNLGQKMAENGGDLAAALPEAFAQAWPQGEQPVQIVGTSGWTPGVMQDFSGSGA